MIFGGMLLYWWAFPQRLPIAIANGIYANLCCGAIKLNNGPISFGRVQIVSYVVEYDNVGRYVLPSAYVGVWNGKAVQADTSANPSKLRLGAQNRPESIELPSGSVAFDFERVGKIGS